MFSQSSQWQKKCPSLREFTPTQTELLTIKWKCVIFSAVKRLITINHIQNKSFHCIIYVCSVYIYVYINIHTYSIYFENIYMYLHFYIYVIYIINKYSLYIKIKIFWNIYMHVCVFIYTLYIYTVHIHILCKQKLLFWMWLITINHLTALVTFVFILNSYK